MSGESDLTFLCSIEHVISFLGGQTSPYLQALLMGRPVNEMTDKECENVRMPCTSALLSQVDFLQEPFDNEVFEDTDKASDWLYAQPLYRRMVRLRPIEIPPVIPYHDDRDRIERNHRQLSNNA